MLKLDRIDRHILELMQENGRISNLELAELVGLSPSPCSRRVKALEDAGLIDTHVTLLNARLSIMSRQYAQARLDLLKASDLIQRHFEHQSRAAQTALSLLQASQQQLQNNKLPDISAAVLAAQSALGPAR